LEIPVAARDAVLIAVVTYAVVTDLRTRRISNRLTYSAAVIGLAINTLAAGWSGLAVSSLGLAVGFGLLLLPFLFGAMGGGDVKLLAAIGAIKGPYFVVVAMIYAGLAGGVLAAGYLARQVGFRPSFLYLTGGWLKKPSGPPRLGIPYAPAIAAGALIAIFY
jgi:prepilin peptidase CpaA